MSKTVGLVSTFSIEGVCNNNMRNYLWTSSELKITDNFYLSMNYCNYRCSTNSLSVGSSISIKIALFDYTVHSQNDIFRMVVILRVRFTFIPNSLIIFPFIIFEAELFHYTFCNNYIIVTLILYNWTLLFYKPYSLNFMIKVNLTKGLLIINAYLCRIISSQNYSLHWFCKY